MFDLDLLNQLSEGVIIAGVDGRLLFVNESAERLHGVKKLDVVPDDYSETYHLFTMDGRPYPFEELPLARAVAQGETVEDARWRIRRPDGTEVIAIGSARPLMTDGRQTGAILNLRNDSERFEAERKLRDSEERLRLVIDAATDYAIFTTDLDRYITSWSQGAQNIFRFSAEEAVGMCADVLWTPDDRQKKEQEKEVETALESGCANDERWHLRSDGSRVFLNGSVHPLPLDEEGRHRGVIKIARDETARHTADAALRDSQEQTKLVLDHTASAFYSVNRNGNTTLVSRPFLDMMGFKDESEALGRKLHDLIHHTHPDGSHYQVEECPIYVCASAATAAHIPEEIFFRLDGAPVPVEYWVAPIMRGDEHLGATCTIIDLTQRKQAETALRESEQRYRTLFEAIEAGFCIVEMIFDGAGQAKDYRFIEVNPAFETQTGLSNATGKTAKELIPDLEQHWFDTYGEIATTQTPLRFENGAAGMEERWFDVYAFPTGAPEANRVAILFNDISSRKRAEIAIQESEARFRNMADHAPVMMWVTEPDGYCSYLNRGWYEFTGQNEDEALGFGWLKAVHPDDAAEAERAFVDANANSANFRVEYRLRRADGEYRWAIDAASPRFGHEGQFLGFVGSVIDIDERREMEEELRLRSDEFEALAENVSQLAWMANSDGNIFWYNRRWYEYTGTTAESQQGWGWESVHDPAALPAVVERWTASLKGGTEFEMTFPLRGVDGIFRPFLTRAVPIRDEANDIVRWFGTNTDVTAQVEADERRRFSLALADRLRDLSDPRQIVSAAVEELGRHLGVTRVGFGEFSQDGKSISFETDYADGVAHLVGTFPIENFGRGNIVDLARGSTTIYPDVTIDPRTKDADWEVIETRAAMAVPLIRDGQMSALLYLNHTQIREWLPHEVALVEDVAARTWDALERARAEAEVHALNTNLEARVIERSAELERAQEALRQSQKMETLGQLTGGIAHDFNNLLQIITGNLDILRRTMTEDSPRLQRSVENAMKGADRAAILTQRLLAFSRRQPLAPKVIDPNKLVAGMSEMLHRTIGETIAIETVRASALWRVEVDPNQLENAILNLAVNSRDAMADGGKLTIETANTHLDHDYSDRHSGVSAGQYVAICVSDTGVGMDISTADRAFDPFFTTKEVGKGTGLGLSMVYGFVKQSGGHLKIYSEPEEGTTVKIYLPRHHGEEELAVEEPINDQLPEGTETILVCEDDDEVRAYSVDSLRELGYRVIEAPDGESALRLLESEGGRVDLLFTDIVLPGGMTGAVVAKQAGKVQPGLKVLFTTGYARNAIVHHGRLDPGVELLSKPFSYADLAARIRDLLDQR